MDPARWARALRRVLRPHRQGTERFKGLFELVGFSEHVVRAKRTAAAPGFRLRMVAENKHQALRSGRADMSQNVETTAVRQREVEQHGFGMDGVEQGCRLGDRGRLGGHLEALRLGDQSAQALTNRRGVFHEQYGHRAVAFHAGIMTRRERDG